MLHQKVMVSQGSTAEPLVIPASGAGTIYGSPIGAAEYPFRAFVKVSAAGAVLAASPAVGATNPSIIASVTRDNAGLYTVVLNAISGVVAANIAVHYTSNTSLIYGTAVVTDETHIAIASATNAGVATDAAFTLEILVLGTP